MRAAARRRREATRSGSSTDDNAADARAGRRDAAEIQTTGPSSRRVIHITAPGSNAGPPSASCRCISHHRRSGALMAVLSPSGAPAEGTHSFTVDGMTLRYHVHGAGPVCVAHPGGPGIAWNYLRSSALEQRLTMVYRTRTADSWRSTTRSTARTSWPASCCTRVRHWPRVRGRGREDGRRARRSARRPSAAAGRAAGVRGDPAHHRRRDDGAGGAPDHPGLRRLVLGRSGPRSAFQDAVQATYISGLDEHGSPDPVDDRAALAALRVPTRWWSAAST